MACGCRKTELDSFVEARRQNTSRRGAEPFVIGGGVFAIFFLKSRIICEA